MPRIVLGRFAASLCSSPSQACASSQSTPGPLADATGAGRGEGNRPVSLALRSAAASSSSGVASPDQPVSWPPLVEKERKNSYAGCRMLLKS